MDDQQLNQIEGGNSFNTHQPDVGMELSEPKHPSHHPIGAADGCEKMVPLGEAGGTGEKNDVLWALGTDDHRPVSPSSRTTLNHVAEMGDPQPSHVEIRERQPRCEKNDVLWALGMDDHHPVSPSSRTTLNHVAEMGDPQPSHVEIRERQPRSHSPVPSTVTVHEEGGPSDPTSSGKPWTSSQPTPRLSLEGIKLDGTSDHSDPELGVESPQGDWSDEEIEEEERSDHPEERSDHPEVLPEEQSQLPGGGSLCPDEVGGKSIVVHDSGGGKGGGEGGGLLNFGEGQRRLQEQWEEAVTAPVGEDRSTSRVYNSQGESNYITGLLDEDNQGESNEEAVIGPADVGGDSLLCYDSGGVPDNLVPPSVVATGGACLEEAAGAVGGARLQETERASDDQAEGCESGTAANPSTSDRQIPRTTLTETSIDAIGPQSEVLLLDQPGTQVQVEEYHDLDGEEWDVHDLPLDVCTCFYQEMAGKRSE